MRAKHLYAITGSREHLLESVTAAIQGGCQIIQYRDKSSDNKRRLDEATGLAALCEAHQCQLIINDDIALAKAVAAHGVHLGQGDDSIKRARDILGAGAIIGATCHTSLELALRAQAQGADYVAFGRFFTSLTKPQAPQADIEVLSAARKVLTIPIIAIGGITLENAPRLLAAGADILAVGHGLFGAKNIKSQARQYCNIIQGSPA